MSVAQYGTLRAIQDELYTALRAETWFADIAIVKMRDEDTDSTIEKQISATTSTRGKKGVVVFIGQPDPSAAAPDLVCSRDNTLRAFYGDIRCLVQIEEDVTENRKPITGTGIPAVTVGEAVVACLQRARTASLAARYCTGPKKLNPEPSPQPDLTVTQLVEVKTEGWATALKSVATDRYP
jgi:hypothetical protein